MRILFALGLCLPLFLLAGCAIRSTDIEPTSTAAPTAMVSAGVYQKITAEQAKTIIDEGDNYILLDVRTPEEFEEKHIEGAMLIPDYEIGLSAEKELPDKNAVVLIYCRSGRRSANAANELIGMGYTQIYDFGGIIDWPYETVSDLPTIP